MKNNRLRVIQINGFKGLVIAGFIVTCLVAGFVGFPGLVAMVGWNYVATSTLAFPTINFAGGLLLWGIVAFSYIAIRKKHFIVSLHAPQNLSDAEVKEMISKMNEQNPSIIMPKSFIQPQPKQKDDDDEKTSVSSGTPHKEN